MASKNVTWAMLATVGLTLCASVSPTSGAQAQAQAQLATFPPAPGPMYVACRAEVPSNNTAYFSATYQAPAVSSARKEFRELVTTQYGAVSQVQCVGKFNPAVVKETVQQWQDKARATNNQIVNTDWQPTAARDHRPPQPESRYAATVRAYGGGIPSSVPSIPPSVPSISTSLQRY